MPNIQEDPSRRNPGGTDVCICCGKPARFAILLATGPSQFGLERYYIPNQTFWEESEVPCIREGSFVGLKWFCHEHIRAVEDAVRATILYHQTENGIMRVGAEGPEG